MRLLAKKEINAPVKINAWQATNLAKDNTDRNTDLLLDKILKEIFDAAKESRYEVYTIVNYPKDSPTMLNLIKKLCDLNYTAYVQGETTHYLFSNDGYQTILKITWEKMGP